MTKSTLQFSLFGNAERIEEFFASHRHRSHTPQQHLDTTLDTTDLASSPTMLDLMNSDLLINIVSHVNVIDSGKFAQTSKRMYYLVHRYHDILGPQLVACSSLENGEFRPVSELYKACVLKLSIRPNLALAFNTLKGHDLSTQLRKSMPGDSVVVGAVADSIQANIRGEVQCESPSAMMMGSLSTERTQMVPFKLPGGELNTLSEQLQHTTPHRENMGSYWKVFIVYVCGSGYYSAESFIAGLQATFPEAAIVGGICDNGFVSQHDTFTKKVLKKKSVIDLRKLLHVYDGGDNDVIYQYTDRDDLVERVFDFMNRKQYHIHEVEDGIFGLALGGDVPVRSIVSRGVRSITRKEISLTEAPSEWYIDGVSLLRPSDENYPFRGDPELLKPVHVIRTLWNSTTDKIVCPMDFLARLEHQPEYIGIRRSGADGFELSVLSPFSLQTNSIIIMTDGSPTQEESLEKANIDFFSLDPKACLGHVDMTLGKLKERTKNEVVLGALMFSCNGRGPEKSCMLREQMADAKRFHKHFPDIPCLGFYAGGEIGPMAMVGNVDVFQTGKAAVQGFTAVFALFIVPEVTPGAFSFDDSDQNVARYLDERMAETAMST